MATILLMSPITLLIQFFSNIGLTLGGGSVSVYAAQTTTPIITYTDSTGTTENANPIALSAAGRLQSAGGAPVAVWVAQGTAHKMVAKDSGGNLVVAIDNLTAINDLSSILTLLATPTSGVTPGGAALVANAVRSYFNFPALRAEAILTTVSGQTLLALAAFQIAEGDLRGGAFYYDSANSSADDNYNFLQPNSIAAGNPGRWVRVKQPYLPSFDGGSGGNPISQGGFASGSFTGQLTGCTASVPVACTYYVLGTATQSAVCILVVNVGGTIAAGTSNSALMTLTGLPAPATPSAAIGGTIAPWIVQDSGAVTNGEVFANSNGTLSFGKVPGSSGGFTTTGSKGIQNGIFVYPLS